MCVHPVLEDLVLIPVHTKPEDAKKEVDELYDVVEAVRKEWKIDVSFIKSVKIMFKLI